MSKRTSWLRRDEESGKRDDDRKPAPTSSWIPKKPPTIRKRRVVVLLIACFLIYVFVKNIPSDLGPANERYQRNLARLTHRRPSQPVHHEIQLDDVSTTPKKAAAPRGAPPVKNRETILGQTVHNFEGPVKFYYLAASLHGVAKTGGSAPKNKNILFAASDLKSVSELVPLACEMARWKRVYVHFAIMGRDELPMDDIKDINGVMEDSCKIFWHDARPDYAIYSTDHRMEISIAGAMKHIQNNIHPQAVIAASSASEDAFFTRALHRKTRELHLTMIQIPQNAADRLLWMSRLDAQSLSAWHSAQIDILVQAPSDNSGSLIRLLKSLEEADYDGFTAPRLTVELPNKINTIAKNYLNNDFQWPPPQFDSHQKTGQLVLRRRIPEKKVDPEHAAVRFIESFYPADNGHSNVLILSPQAQLSPIFFHTLKYYLLEYKHSELAWISAANMFGISLDAPSVHLNGTSGFEPPVTSAQQKSGGDSVSLYLYQAPNSNAALYFGDKWIEAHSFLTQHLTASKHPLTRDLHQKRKKLVSHKYPQWAEYFLDLMRARGYFMLYPALPTIEATKDNPEMPANSLVVVHNELYEPPEEFQGQKPKISNADGHELDADGVLEADSSYLTSHLDPKASKDQSLNAESPLFSNIRPMVPEDVAPSSEEDIHEEDNDKPVPGALPAVHLLSCLDYKADSVSIDALFQSAGPQAANYRREAGGCTAELAESKKSAGDWSADDLFCLPALPDEQLASDEEPNLVDTGSKGKAPTRTTPHVFREEHATGAAEHINAAVDPERYQETARAGMQAKLDGAAAQKAQAAGGINGIPPPARPGSQFPMDQADPLPDISLGGINGVPPPAGAAAAAKLAHAPEDINPGHDLNPNLQGEDEATRNVNKAAEAAYPVGVKPDASASDPKAAAAKEAAAAELIEQKASAEQETLLGTGHELPPQIKKEPGASPPSSGDGALLPDRRPGASDGGFLENKLTDAAAAGEAPPRAAAGLPLRAPPKNPGGEELDTGSADFTPGQPGRGKIRGFDVGGIDEVKETEELKARRKSAQLKAAKDKDRVEGQTGGLSVEDKVREEMGKEKARDRIVKEGEEGT